MILERSLTSFARMAREQTPDGMGGTRVQLTPEKLFLGVIAPVGADEVTPGGLTAARTRTVLLHLPGVSLHPGDVVQRVFDAARWRVLGSSEDMTAPRMAGGGLSQVPVERLVVAP